MLKRISTINLSVVSIVFSFIVLFALVGCGNVTGTTSGSGTTSGPGVTPTVNSSPTPSPASAVPFKVTSIDMAVNPTTIAGLKCGTYITVTYTATFHVAPNSPGGTVQFMYTVNNGRGSTMASLVFAPGETTKTYTFTWSGNLPPDHTYPEPGGVMTSSPNQVTSQLVGPSGMCS